MDEHGAPEWILLVALCWWLGHEQVRRRERELVLEIGQHAVLQVAGTWG